MKNKTVDILESDDYVVTVHITHGANAYGRVKVPVMFTFAVGRKAVNIVREVLFIYSK